MCILFLHTQPFSKAGHFRLILAANRDESFVRPSMPIHFWKEDEMVVGGRDLEPGKEGGAWLALSAKNGKLGALLNIMTPVKEHPSSLLGRGSLVANFVRGSESCMNYLQKVAEDGANYRPFNLLTVQLRANGVDINGYSSIGNKSELIAINENYLGMSNSEFSSPFLKVTAGNNRFKEITERLGDVPSKCSLVKELHNFLQWKDSHFPDPILAERAPDMSSEILLPLSSVFVSSPKRAYGTRAHSIILVDDKGYTDFHEWSMKFPIDSSNPVWDHNHLTCQVQVQ